MNFSETKLKGLFIIEPEPFIDERGVFFRAFCKKEFREVGLKKEFVQINQSINLKKYTFRGLHYQIHPYSDSKLIRCINGKVFDIIVDVRKKSETFLSTFTIELSSENKKMLFVPKGFAHGFLTLEDNSKLIYHHTSYYQPGFEGEINVQEPMINVKLPHTIKIISNKDLNIPFLDLGFKGV